VAWDIVRIAEAAPDQVLSAQHEGHECRPIFCIWWYRY